MSVPTPASNGNCRSHPDAVPPFNAIVPNPALMNGSTLPVLRRRIQEKSSSVRVIAHWSLPPSFVEISFDSVGEVVSANDAALLPHHREYSTEIPAEARED